MPRHLPAQRPLARRSATDRGHGRKKAASEIGRRVFDRLLVRARRSFLVAYFRRWWWVYDFVILPFAFILFIIAGMVVGFVAL